MCVCSLTCSSVHWKLIEGERYFFYATNGRRAMYWDRVNIEERATHFCRQYSLGMCWWDASSEMLCEQINLGDILSAH